LGTRSTIGAYTSKSLSDCAYVFLVILAAGDSEKQKKRYVDFHSAPHILTRKQLPTVNTKKSGQPKSKFFELAMKYLSASWAEFYGVRNVNLKVLRESGRNVSEIAKIQAR
jgi:hypothetical protein